MNKWIYIEAEKGKLDELKKLLKDNHIDYDYVGSKTVMVLNRAYPSYVIINIITNDCVKGYWYD